MMYILGNVDDFRIVNLSYKKAGKFTEEINNK